MRPALALPALLALLALPSALAQGPFSMGDVPPPPPLQPGGEETAVPLRVTVPCVAVAGPVLVEVERAPAWIVARVEPARADPPVSCEGAWVATSTLHVAAAASAPGMKEDAVALRVRLGEESRGISVPVKAAFVARLVVEADDTPKSAPPQDVISFALHLSNLGNAVTRVTIDASATGGFIAPAPSPVTLQSPLEGGRETKLTVPLSVMTPYRTGHVDEGGVVTVRITPAYALDPTMQGESQTLTFRVHSVGYYAPGIGAGAAVALVGLAAALRARRD